MIRPAKPFLVNQKCAIHEEFSTHIGKIPSLFLLRQAKSVCLLNSIPSFFQLYNLYALAPMFITSASLFSIWQTVDTLDFCWLALFLALSAKTCFYEQNSHPEKTIPAITPPCNLDSFAEKCFHLRKTTWELRKLHKIQSCFLED